MPKLEQGVGALKISIDRIIETGNVRKEYTDIEGLAQSIKAHGLIQPVAVKLRGKNAEGMDEYELVSGHRRIRAIRHLASLGEPYTQVDAVIVSGDKQTLQLVENIQRSDLTPEERERSVSELAASCSVSAAAALLGKPEEYVRRNEGAWRVRMIGQSHGIDLSQVSTQALYEFRLFSDDDIIAVLKDSGKGLSVSAARTMSAVKRTPPAPAAESSPGSNDDPPPRPRTEGKEAARGPMENREENAPMPIPWHKMIDLNLAISVIIKYRDDCFTLSLYERYQAAQDIIAILHRET